MPDSSLADARLAMRKDFVVRRNEILLRWIVEGPAGAIEVYVPVRIGDNGEFDASKAEVHRHAFRETPESCEALRTDCDLMPDGRCYFTKFWGAAARDAWYEAAHADGGGEAEVWRFLHYAYSREFNTEPADKPPWLT